MDNPIRQKCQEMLKILDDVKKLKDQKDGIFNSAIKVSNKDAEIIKLKENISKEYAEFDKKLSEIFGIIGGATVTPKAVEAMPSVPVNVPAAPVATSTVAPTASSSIPKPGTIVEKKVEQQVIISPELASQRFRRLSSSQKERYIQELSISYEQLEDFISHQKSGTVVGGEIKKEDYTLYIPKEEAVVANKYAKRYADQIVNSHPEWFKTLFDQYQKVNMNYLSRSWISMIIFYSVLSIPASLVLLLLLKFAFKDFFQMGFGIIVLGMFLLPIAIVFGLYFYPGSLMGDRAQRIKNELPFALIHMSSVAGSGAQPISIFELLTESNEYPELKTEIRKILNYVNLFGYNLTLALKNTAATTPSQELKELLNGMVSTIETGGDLRAYLKGKADDALNTHRLERKKEVESLGTYSEIYTSILIAAPLLLVVTLAIMNSITGSIAGMSILTISYLGVGLGLPLLNIGFIVFLKMQTSNL